MNKHFLVFLLGLIIFTAQVENVALPISVFYKLSILSGFQMMTPFVNLASSSASIPLKFAEQLLEVLSSTITSIDGSPNSVNFVNELQADFNNAVGSAEKFEKHAKFFADMARITSKCAHKERKATEEFWQRALSEGSEFMMNQRDAAFDVVAAIESLGQEVVNLWMVGKKVFEPIMNGDPADKAITTALFHGKEIESEIASMARTLINAWDDYVIIAGHSLKGSEAGLSKLEADGQVILDNVMNCLKPQLQERLLPQPGNFLGPGKLFNKS